MGESVGLFPPQYAQLYADVQPYGLCCSSKIQASSLASLHTWLNLKLTFWPKACLPWNDKLLAMKLTNCIG